MNGDNDAALLRRLTVHLTRQDLDTLHNFLYHHQHLHEVSCNYFLTEVQTTLQFLTLTHSLYIIYDNKWQKVVFTYVFIIT